MTPEIKRVPLSLELAGKLAELFGVPPAASRLLIDFDWGSCSFYYEVTTYITDDQIEQVLASDLEIPTGPLAAIEQEDPCCVTAASEATS